MRALPGNQSNGRLCLHPSVGTSVDPSGMDDRQRVAVVAKLRSLQHDLEEETEARPSQTRASTAQLLSCVNELRRALGWPEIPSSPKRPRLTVVMAG